MVSFEEMKFSHVVVVPRLHEEIADLRRLIGLYEDALDEIEQDAESLEKCEAIAARVLHNEPDMTPADYVPGWGFCRKDDDAA